MAGLRTQSGSSQDHRRLCSPLDCSGGGWAGCLITWGQAPGGGVLWAAWGKLHQAFPVPTKSATGFPCPHKECHFLNSLSSRLCPCLKVRAKALSSMEACRWYTPQLRHPPALQCRSHHCPSLSCICLWRRAWTPSQGPLCPPAIPSIGPSQSPTHSTNPPRHSLTPSGFLTSKPGWLQLHRVRGGSGETDETWACPVSERRHKRWPRALAAAGPVV